MQTTYHINADNLDSKFLKSVKAAFGRKNIKIVIEDVQSDKEKEKLFFSLFGSWEGEESGDELVEKIYSSRVSGSRDIEL